MLNHRVAGQATDGRLAGPLKHLVRIAALHAGTANNGRPTTRPRQARRAAADVQPLCFIFKLTTFLAGTNFLSITNQDVPTLVHCEMCQFVFQA